MADIMKNRLKLERHCVLEITQFTIDGYVQRSSTIGSKHSIHEFISLCFFKQEYNVHEVRILRTHDS